VLYFLIWVEYLMTNNEEIAHAFDEIADLLEIEEANPSACAPIAMPRALCVVWDARWASWRQGAMT
jgi:hypothetical protein